MKLLITFVLGACTGAFLLWAGFHQEVLRLGNDRLVRVNRFTGEASYVFVSALELEQRERAESEERERAERAERDRKAALAKGAEGKMPGLAAAAAKTKAARPGWRELTAEEIAKLEFKWGPKYRSLEIELSFHNPFEQMVEIEQVHVVIPAHDGRAAIDRMYQVRSVGCMPLADWETQMPGEVLMDAFLPGQKGGAVSTDPFNGPPGASGPPGVVGSITPARVMISL